MNRCHSIKNKADEARRRVALSLVDEVDEAISSLRETIIVDRLSRGLALG